MIARWQISAGEISEWLPPFLFASAVLVSAWVLYDSRRRARPLYAVCAWTLATLLSPPIVLPLYLAARLFTQKPGAPVEVEPDTSESEPATSPVDMQADASLATQQTQISSEADQRPDEQADAHTVDARTAEEIRSHARHSRRKNYAPAFLYALALLFAGALYFYRDYHSFDAHAARAANARLLGQHAASIRSYRAALRISDDAHTRKLLAVQLAEAGQMEAALAEFRAAERAGDDDELLPYRIARALDSIGRPAEAIVEYQKFLRGNWCARSPLDARCAEVAARLGHTRGSVVAQ